MIYAWLGAALVGVSLGLLGSGGSILTVPLLVYVVGEPQKLAIAESLAIVGGISVVGALPFVWRRQVHWRSVLWFGLPGMAGTFAGAYLSQFVSSAVQLSLFALIMLVAAVTMWQGRERETGTEAQLAWQIVLEGLGVGLVTGLVGVGGGFLIIPALVILGGLPMQLAVGTSLSIITLNALSGFAKHLNLLSADQVNWSLVGLFIGLGILGSFVGSALSQRLPQALLRRVFAGALVLMGIYILYTNLPAAAGVQPSWWWVTAGVLTLLALLFWLSTRLRVHRASDTL